MEFQAVNLAKGLFWSIYWLCWMSWHIWMCTKYIEYVQNILYDFIFVQIMHYASLILFSLFNINRLIFLNWHFWLFDNFTLVSKKMSNFWQHCQSKYFIDDFRIKVNLTPILRLKPHNHNFATVRGVSMEVLHGTD